MDFKILVVVCMYVPRSELLSFRVTVIDSRHRVENRSIHLSARLGEADKINKNNYK
jgi:hypothetical protein